MPYTLNVAGGESAGKPAGKRKKREPEEEEETDSEATGEESGESFPRCRSRALRSMPDDNEAGTRRGGEDSPLVPRKGRSGVVLPGSALALGQSEANSGLPDAPSASGPPKADPSCRLSSFKFGRRLLESANNDQ